MGHGQKDKGIVTVYPLYRWQKVKVAVDAYAVIEGDLLIERQAQFPPCLDLIAMHDGMTWVRYDGNFILRVNIPQKSPISFIKAYDGIPLKLIKCGVFGWFSLVDHKDGFRPAFYGWVDFEEISHGQDLKVLHHKDIAVLIEKGGSVKKEALFPIGLWESITSFHIGLIGIALLALPLHRG
jgi:hypothetical protein